MPLASLANLQWYGPASLAVVDDAIAEEDVQPGAYNNIRSVEDAASGAVILMTRVRSMELNDDAVSDAAGAMKQVSSIRFASDVGAAPSATAIAQEVWGQSLAAFATAGTAGDQLKKALTVAKFLGLK